MKVRLIKTADCNRHPGWIRFERDYDVLEMYIYKDGKIDIRLISDENGTPAIFPLSDFQIVCQKVYQDWSFEALRDGAISLAPNSWLESNFWEKYFNDDPETVSIFDNEVKKILAH